MAEFGWTPLSKAFAELDVLPPFPVVFNKILEITESDAGSREELLKALSLDQAIAAQVLRASNSVFYGMAGRVGTLDRAVPFSAKRRSARLPFFARRRGSCGGTSAGTAFSRSSFGAIRSAPPWRRGPSRAW